MAWTVELLGDPTPAWNPPLAITDAAGILDVFDARDPDVELSETLEHSWWNGGWNPVTRPSRIRFCNPVQ